MAPGTSALLQLIFALFSDRAIVAPVQDVVGDPADAVGDIVLVKFD
ncbi:hypothetical protein [Mucilaginibacter oryzae]|nr:hypothetical protein [Mucilaginibacter oryzae]